jgi:hypothetical protein
LEDEIQGAPQISALESRQAFAEELLPIDEAAALASEDRFHLGEKVEHREHADEFALGNCGEALCFHPGRDRQHILGIHDEP